MTMVFNDNMPEFAGRNAKTYVDKETRHCPYCLGSQTIVQKLKKITEEFEKQYVKFVWDFIIDNDLKIFSKKELMIQINIRHISDGVLQDKALSVLTLLGFLRKERHEYLDKKGNTKPYFRFIKNIKQTSTECYNKEKDCHKAIDWFGVAIKGRCFNK